MKRRLAAFALTTVVAALGAGGVVDSRVQDTQSFESSAGFSPIAQLVESAIGRHELPGAVVLVGRGDTIVYHRAFGQRAVAPSPEPMTEDTIFDLASLTKVVATTTAILQLVEAGRVDLDAPAWTYLPGFGRVGKRAITVRHLLTHTSGLPAIRDFYKRLLGPSEIVDAVERTRPVGRPSAQVVYSDLGFIALGALVVAVTREALDDYTNTHILRPLGMQDTLYRPPPSLRPRIAATEDQPLRGLVWGEVHDENAQAMGGVSGHAGLFAPRPPQLSSGGPERRAESPPENRSAQPAPRAANRHTLRRVDESTGWSATARQNSRAYSLILLWSKSPLSAIR